MSEKLKIVVEQEDVIVVARYIGHRNRFTIHRHLNNNNKNNIIMKHFYFKTCIILLIAFMCGYSLQTSAKNKSESCAENNSISNINSDDNSKAYEINEKNNTLTHDWVYANPGKSSIQVRLSQVKDGTKTIYIHLRDNNNNSEVCEMTNKLLSEGDDYFLLYSINTDVTFIFDDNTSLVYKNCFISNDEGDCGVEIGVKEEESQENQLLIKKFRSNDLKKIIIWNYSIPFVNFHSKSTLILMDSMNKSEEGGFDDWFYGW